MNRTRTLVLVSLLIGLCYATGCQRKENRKVEEVDLHAKGLKAFYKSNWQEAFTYWMECLDKEPYNFTCMVGIVRLEELTKGASLLADEFRFRGDTKRALEIQEQITLITRPESAEHMEARKKIALWKSELPFEFARIMLSPDTYKPGAGIRQVFIPMEGPGGKIEQVDVRPAIVAALEGREGSFERLDELLLRTNPVASIEILAALPRELREYLDSRVDKLAEDKDWRVRSVLLDSAIHLELPSRRTLALKLVEDKDQDIRHRAAKYLCESGEKEYCKIFFESYLPGCRDSKEKKFLGITLDMKGHRQRDDEVHEHKVRIEFICPGSPAEKAGLRMGDRPVSINKKVVRYNSDFLDVAFKETPVHIVAMRGSERIEITIEDRVWDEPAEKE